MRAKRMMYGLKEEWGWSLTACWSIMLVALLLVGCNKQELVWQEETGYRWADLHVQQGDTGFQRLAAQKTGVTFVNHLTHDQIAENRHRMHGSGVALGDIDGDGWTDIYLARLDGNNVLYKNKGGWKFEDITSEAGVDAPDRFSTGAVFADLEGDGDLDLLVTAMGGPNAAYLNNGQGQFEEATTILGLSSSKGSTSMALADIEGDGDLDLYVTNYKRTALRDSLPPDRIAWERVVLQNDDDYFVSPEFEDHYTLRIHGTKILRLESGESDQLYLNDGNGQFAAAQLSGNQIQDIDGTPLSAELLKDWGLAVRFQDLNGDLAPDLYVCNDFESPDYIWLNDGQGNFKAAAPLAFRKTSNATMSVAVSDVNRDGNADIFLADMLSMDHNRRKRQKGTQVPLPAVIGEIENRPQVMQNTLLLNRGDQSYAEVANLGGLQASEWTWSSAFLDVDLDGYEDLVVTNGHAFDVQDADAQLNERRQISRVRSFDAFRRLLLDFPPLNLQNVAFRNEGGVKFASQPNGWGLGTETDVSHGMAMADLDNDGDLDIVVNRLNQTAGVFENTGAAPRVIVRLKGKGKNTQGIGAKIQLHNSAIPVQEKEVISGGFYLSGSDPVYTFAAHPTAANMALEVTWRSGSKSRIDGIRSNRLYEIEEPSTSTTQDQPTAALNKNELFVEVPVDYQHTEAIFDDFERQPLLPRRFSQAGPAVVWADLDRDGDDDLLVGSGRDGQIGYFRNQAGTLVRQRNGILSQSAEMDQLGMVVIPQGNGARVLVAMSNYEMPRGAESLIRVYAVEGNRWRKVQDLSFGTAGIGPLAMADIDNDGDLDVFAGGHVQPGNYPAPVSSRLYLNNGNGTFEPAASLNAPFTSIGMVNGAVFGDIDLDGDQDLVLALSWGALTYFENDGAGNFSDQSQQRNLSTYTGLWHGVDLGDFNGDGRLDIVATNWGLNSQYPKPENPLHLYWGDYDRNGVTDIIESYYEPSLNGYVPQAGLNLLMYSLPFLGRRIGSFEDFSTMTVPQMLDIDPNNTDYHEAAHLAHKVFLNTGETFNETPLPLLAQVSPGFGVGIGDYNGDGFEDTFIAQNFFAERLDVPRSDAGRGLWLKGNGKAGFEIAEGIETGIKVYGEQRGMGLSDYNGDGKLDIAISQNGHMLKLYRNEGAAPGMRIKLIGPAANPWGIGSQVKLSYTDGSQGPVRNVSAGSGYLGQNTATQVLGIENGKTVEKALVRWPDGNEQEITVQPDMSEIVIRY